ncbi:hypothetical protein [Flavobacterium sp. 2]|uniref:hypothetical protein n=1 Tax=Flavobacterium sp. 2 TaxID=308053 RepID=UPI000C1A0403|nr:hypothetical protein [Flavobacterium sp. 2]PIF59044.1 hypothetical protein CLU99_4012 [Flavobacterium sp. 2]
MKKLLFIALVAFSTSSFAINPKTEINLPATEIQTTNQRIEGSMKDNGFEFCYEIGRTIQEVAPGLYEETVYYHCTKY